MPWGRWGTAWWHGHTEIENPTKNVWAMAIVMDTADTAWHAGFCPCAYRTLVPVKFGVTAEVLGVCPGLLLFLCVGPGWPLCHARWHGTLPPSPNLLWVTQVSLYMGLMGCVHFPLVLHTRAMSQMPPAYLPHRCTEAKCTGLLYLTVHVHIGCAGNAPGNLPPGRTGCMLVMWLLFVH